MRKLATSLFRLLASLKMAVVLIVVLAAVLAAATCLEASRGRDYTQWYVYHTDWFTALLALLGVNILAATLLRFPWQKRQIPFLVTHAGLLVLLAGSIQTRLGGIDGTLALEEGKPDDALVLRDRSRFRVRWNALPARDDRPAAAFLFTPGPVDWPAGKRLHVGAISGVSLDVIRFLRHARMEERWIAAENGAGAPALKFALVSPESVNRSENWLAVGQYGAQAAIGSTQIDFQQAGADSLLDDFLHPPAHDKDMDKYGTLSIHYDGHVQRIPVSENLGKKIAVGQSGMEVEVVEYLPNALPKTDGRFVSQGADPKNPLLELRVHAPGKKEPMRQIAFAKLPFLTLDGVRGKTSAVKFWYHHPAHVPTPGVEFLALPNGKLYCRVAVGGKYQPHGEVKPRDSIPTWANSSITVVDYLPHAHRDVSYQPVSAPPSASEAPEAAAQVELTADGVTRQLWLARSDADGPGEAVKTPAGTLNVCFGYEHRPLGFALRLKKFAQGVNPGGVGVASYASTVEVLDEAGNAVAEREISMNEPLARNHYMFYQSGVLPEGRGTILTVARDPGLATKYLGSLMICLGTLVMFCAKSHWFQGRCRPSRTAQPPVEERIIRRAAAAILVTLSLGGAAYGDSPDHPAFDWKMWRALAVQDGGRQKPLDSLAWETLRLIGNRTSFIDPDSNEKLDATAMYLALLLDWQGWDKPAAGPHAMTGMQASPHGGGTHAGMLSSGPRQPDKWDQCDLILVDALELRTALGLPEERKYVSAYELSQAKLRNPQTQAVVPLLSWTQQLAMQPDHETSSLEQKAVELANRYWAYQDLRAGRKLEILPIPGNEEQAWASLDYLMRTPLDDKTDSSGAVRAIKEKFQAVRAAYRAKSPAEFRAATLAFLAAVRETGAELGDYPAQQTIDREVAYNHWVPFRFAWVLVLLAGLSMLLYLGTHWNAFRLGSFAAYVGGLVAMLIGFGMRISLSGRAPVTNMYESVIYVGLGVAVIGLVLELIYRKQFILVAAAAVSTLTLILADNCPAILDPSLQPLQPVLRNNFWLVTHVMTITLSYAAFALALGIANITLGYYLCGSENAGAIAALTRFTYRAVQVGVVLLAAGTVLGGVWAAYSWGRFWGWDPKEVWALITLLGYTAVLHARYAGWVAHRGLAALAVLCFALVVIAWYGVNFVLGAGLHSYGFSPGGGKAYVGAALALQCLYVLAATLRAGPGSSRLADAEQRDATVVGLSDPHYAGHASMTRGAA